MGFINQLTSLGGTILWVFLSFLLWFFCRSPPCPQDSCAFAQFEGAQDAVSAFAAEEAAARSAAAGRGWDGMYLGKCGAKFYGL